METGGARGMEGARRGAGRPGRHLGGASQHGLRSIVDEVVGGEGEDVLIRGEVRETKWVVEGGGCWVVDRKLGSVVFRCGAEPISARHGGKYSTAQVQVQMTFKSKMSVRPAKMLWCDGRPKIRGGMRPIRPRSSPNEGRILKSL